MPTRGSAHPHKSVCPKRSCRNYHWRVISIEVGASKRQGKNADRKTEMCRGVKSANTRGRDGKLVSTHYWSWWKLFWHSTECRINIRAKNLGEAGRKGSQARTSRHGSTKFGNQISDMISTIVKRKYIWYKPVYQSWISSDVPHSIRAVWRRAM